MGCDKIMRVIINADDYGRSESQTEAIIASFKKHLITTTTIMVNMPDFERSILRAKEEGLMGVIGIHLNLTEGMPLTEDIKQCPRICNKDGTYNKAFHRSRGGRLFFSRREAHAVAIEMEAQMRRYVDAGFTMMHIDSHHHVHTDFSVIKEVLPIARKLGFKSIRLSRNLTVTPSNFIKWVYKWYYNRKITRGGFLTTDYFEAAWNMGDGKLLVEGKTLELMVHPNFLQDDSSGQGRLVDMRVPIEYLERFLNANASKIELISYNDISR